MILDFRLPIFRFNGNPSGRVSIEWGDVLLIEYQMSQSNMVNTRIF